MKNNKPLTYKLLKKLELVSIYSTLIFYCILFICTGMLAIQVFMECFNAARFIDKLLIIIGTKLITVIMAILIIYIQRYFAKVKILKNQEKELTDEFF